MHFLALRELSCEVFVQDLQQTTGYFPVPKSPVAVPATDCEVYVSSNVSALLNFICPSHYLNWSLTTPAGRTLEFYSTEGVAWPLCLLQIPWRGPVAKISVGIPIFFENTSATWRLFSGNITTMSRTAKFTVRGVLGNLRMCSVGDPHHP